MVNGYGLEAHLPPVNVGLHDFFHGGVLGHVDRLGYGPGQEGLDGGTWISGLWASEDEAGGARQDRAREEHDRQQARRRDEEDRAEEPVPVGGIAAGFVDAVFLVDVDRLDRQPSTQRAEYGGCLVPGGGGADQQGNIQLAERLAQVLQVAQPEVDFARCIIVGQPLFGSDQVHGRNRASLAGGGQGGVVV